MVAIMNLPTIKVEADGELELGAAIVGPVPAGTEFSVQHLIVAGNGTLPDRKGFLLTEVIDLSTITL